MDKFEFAKTPGGKLLEELREMVHEMIFVPNDILPEEFQDNVRGGRTLKRIEEICDKRDSITEHQKVKAKKAENIEIYRQQIENGEEIGYNGHVNELQLYKNQMAMVAGMVQSGMIDEEDFE